jgi:hypothetical protein
MLMANSALKANLTNPGRVYLWNLMIANPIGSSGSSETISLRCLTTELPGRSFGSSL